MKTSAHSADGFWKRMQQMLGKDFSEFERFQKMPLRKTIRVNTLKNSIPDFLSWVQKTHHDWILTPHPFAPELFLIDRENRKSPLGKSLGHISGRFYLQEASSAIPPRALFLEPNLKVLDAAAAPGSKTTQIAAQMQNSGLLIANEFSASRSKILVFNVQKCGVGNAIITNFSAEKFGEKLPNFFDRILLDAPCTGEGTFRKDLRALDKWSEKNILAAAKLQKSLIENAFRALAPDGILVYSTCTLAPEENEAVVDFLQQKFPKNAEIIDLRKLFPGAKKAAALTEYEGRTFANGEKMLRIFPHLFDSEGFFVAAIRKTASTPGFAQRYSAKSPNTNAKILRNKSPLYKQVYDFFQKELGFKIPSERSLIQKENEIFLAPPHADTVLSALKVDRPGLKLGKIAGTDVRIAHEAVIALGRHFCGNRVVGISPDETEAFLRGKNLPTRDEAPLGDLVIFGNGMPLGVAKNTEKILKNNIQRNFVQGN